MADPRRHPVAELHHHAGRAEAAHRPRDGVEREEAPHELREEVREQDREDAEERPEVEDDERFRRERCPGVRDVTHDQTEAMTLGTRIVVMKDGVVQQVDTPQNLYNAPGNLFVAGFIGSPQMNFLDATVKVNGKDVTLQVGNYSLKLPENKAKALIDGGYDGKTVVMGIRPENVTDDATAFPESTVEAKINVYELLGAEVFLYFDVEGFNMTARVDPHTTSRTGDTVKFGLDMTKVHVFDKETELTITN